MARLGAQASTARQRQARICRAGRSRADLFVNGVSIYGRSGGILRKRRYRFVRTKSGINAIMTCVMKINRKSKAAAAATMAIALYRRKRLLANIFGGRRRGGGARRRRKLKDNARRRKMSERQRHRERQNIGNNRRVSASSMTLC